MALKLKASARENRRYFFVSSGKEKVEKTILDYLGILGFAKSGYKYVKKSGGKIIGSCTRESLNDVRAALAMAGLKLRKLVGR